MDSFEKCEQLLNTKLSFDFVASGGTTLHLYLKAENLTYMGDYFTA
jgi:hypothetical protein